MVRRAALLLLIVAASASAQTPQRRLTTVHAVRQFPGFYHLQNVLLRGEFSDDLGSEASAKEADARLALRSGDQELRIVLDDGVKSARGPVEVRGYVVDVGRLNPDDPRLGPFAERRDQGSWPKPGEELFLRASAVSDAQVPATPSIRALALEPWRYAGNKITLTGNFRGRNLFGDQPGAPAKSRYDFVLRGAEGTIWVTGLRPRGRGFELDVDRRIDSDRWVEVTGTVVHDKGLVMVEGATLTLAKAPEVQTVPVETVPDVPKLPVEVVFHSPREGETDVRPGETIRVQFSRGLNEKTLAGRTRVTVVGAAADTPGVAHTAVYDAGSRSVAIRFDAPLPAFSTVRVEILSGVLGFDGAPVTPFTTTFNTGG
jgi:hypothetical protein